LIVNQLVKRLAFDLCYWQSINLLKGLRLTYVLDSLDLWFWQSINLLKCLLLIYVL